MLASPFTCGIGLGCSRAQGSLDAPSEHWYETDNELAGLTRGSLLRYRSDKSNDLYNVFIVQMTNITVQNKSSVMLCCIWQKIQFM